MRDASWDNGGETRAGRSRPWLKWLLSGVGLMVGIPLLLAATFGSLALRHRAQVWPAVRAVHARLQTDEDARELFVKNPALANAYKSDQDFLGVVRDWRAKVGDLPIQEPPEGPTYSPDSDPGGAGAAIQGAGGAWMRVDILGGTLAGPIPGEGITRIFFGEDKKALRSARNKANAFKTQRDWEEFRRVMLQCSDDTKAGLLYHQEPGLQVNYRTESDFLAAMKALQPAIAKLPETPREDGYQFSVRNRRTPFTHSRIMIFTDTEGQWLVATWKSDRLSNLELRTSNHHK